MTGFSTRNLSNGINLSEKSESRDQGATPGFIATAEASMSRSYPRRPIPAVGAVVIKDREVLLVMRGKDPGYGQWSIPGGAIQLGETMEQAVVREIREEVGILIDPVRLVETLDRIVRDEQGSILYHYVLLDFLCLYRSGKIRPGSDAIKARWVKEADLGRYALVGETEKVIRKGLEMAIRRGRGPYDKYQMKNVK